MALAATRHGERVRFDNNIHLLPVGGPSPVVARASNLSESGVFVTAADPWDVGTELLCELPLEHQRWLRVKGRVAWSAQAPTRSGMGIQFIDLSDQDYLQLRHTVAEGELTGQRLRVWFEGMHEPVAAQAHPTSEGFTLQTALPFLRLGSEIAFARGDEQGAPRRGELRAASLVVYPGDTVPRLTVQVVGLDGPLEDEEESFELSVELDTDALSAGRIATPQAAEPRDGAVCSGVIETSPPAALAHPLQEQLLYEPEQAYLGAADEAARSHWRFGEDDEEADPDFWQDAAPRRGGALLWLGALTMLGLALASAWYTGLLTRLGGALTELSAPKERTVSAQPSAAPFAGPVSAGPAATGTGPGVETERPALAAAAPAAASSPAAPPAQAKATVKPTTAAPSATASTPGMAAILGGAARAASAPAQDGAQRSETVLQAPSRVVAKPSKRKASVTPRGAAGASGAFAASTGGRAPQLATRGGRFSLRVPLRGSLKEANIYPLADPPGLVAKLPQARSALARKHYRWSSGPVRVLWVRPQLGGVQVRFLYRKGARCALELEAGAAVLGCQEDLALGTAKPATLGKKVAHGSAS